MELRTKLNTKILTGMFCFRESIDHAFERLNERGYTIDDINLVMSEETCRKQFLEKDGEVNYMSPSPGDDDGGIKRVVTRIGTSLIIPNYNNFDTTFSSDRVTCALVGAGVPIDRISLYEDGIKNGNIIMRVRPRTDEDAEQFQRSWIVNSGMNIYL